MDILDGLGFFVLIGFIMFCIYTYCQTDSFLLKCIVSTVDGNKYCVRENSKMNESADLLATTTVKLQELVNYMAKKYPTQANVKRLVANFNPKQIMETLPTSNYTAYSENKGEKIAFCLNVVKGKENLIDGHTLMFVAIHELSHVMTVSIGHKEEFWDNFKFLLENAKESHIHEPVDYSKEPTEYCSMKITDSPYYEYK